MIKNLNHSDVLKILDLSQDLGHDLREFFRDSDGRVSHRFDQPSNQNRLTAKSKR